MAIDGGAERRQLRLVEHLVAFEVERPVAGAGVLGDHLLLRVDEAALGHAVVPTGVDEPDLGLDRRQGVQAFGGGIVARAQGDDELVDQRQQRPDRGFERKAPRHAVAQEGEAADDGALGRRCGRRGS